MFFAVVDCKVQLDFTLSLFYFFVNIIVFYYLAPLKKISFYFQASFFCDFVAKSGDLKIILIYCIL